MLCTVGPLLQGLFKPLSFRQPEQDEKREDEDARTWSARLEHEEHGAVIDLEVQFAHVFCETRQYHALICIIFLWMTQDDASFDKPRKTAHSRKKGSQTADPYRAPRRRKDYELIAQSATDHFESIGADKHNDPVPKDVASAQ